MSGRERRSGWVQRADEATLAVVAHGLLRSVTVVQGGVETLRLRGATLDETVRDEILSAVMDHAVLIGASLQDLVRGITDAHVPSTDEVDLGVEGTDGIVVTAGALAQRGAGPSWVPRYACCPRCRYRGVYAVLGRGLIRCRYCRAVGSLSDDECGEAAEHPDRFVARLFEGRQTPARPEPWG